jgi:hypothetical protein
MAHPTKQSWTLEQTERLKTLLDTGASAARAAGALNRTIASVQVKARLMGRKFPGVQEVRKKLNQASPIPGARDWSR